MPIRSTSTSTNISNSSQVPPRSPNPPERKDVNVPKNEVKNLSWLSQPQNKNQINVTIDPMKLFALETADAFIKSEPVDGVSFAPFVEHFTDRLKKITKNDEVKVDLNPFKQLKDFSKELEIIRQTPLEDRPKATKKFEEKLEKRIANMERGSEIWIPSELEANKAIIHLIQRQRNGKYSWTIINSSPQHGLEHHPKVLVNGQYKYQAFVSYENIDPKLITAPHLSNSLVEMNLENGSSNQIYDGLLTYLKGKEVKAVDFRKFPHLYVKAARSDSSSIKSLNATLLWLTCRGIKSKHSKQVAFNQYKKIKFLYKKESLINACHHFFSLDTLWTKSDHKRISTISAKLARSAIKLYEKGVISQEELRECNASFQDIREKLNNKKHRHLDNLKHLPIDKYESIPSRPLSENLAPNKPSIAIDIPKPQEFAQKNGLDLLKEWLSFIQVAPENPEEDKQRSEAFATFVRSLPIPSREADNFWQSIPEDNLNDYVALIEELIRTKTPGVSSNISEESLSKFTLMSIYGVLVENKHPDFWTKSSRLLLDLKHNLIYPTFDDILRFNQVSAVIPREAAGQPKAEVKKVFHPVIPAIDGDRLSVKNISHTMTTWANSLNDLVYPYETKVAPGPLPAPLLICDSVINCMRVLPVPKRDEPDVWSKLPLEQIEPCMKALTDISQAIYKCDTPRPLPIPLFISLYTALAICEKLARRLPESRLDNKKVDYTHLIELTQSPSIKISNPVDQQKLTELVDFFNQGDFDFSHPIYVKEIEKKRKEMIFYCSYIDFSRPQEESKELIEYYRQFLDDPKISAKINKYMPQAAMANESDKIIFLLTSSYLRSDQILPPSVSYLNQLSVTCLAAVYQITGADAYENEAFGIFMRGAKKKREKMEPEKVSRNFEFTYQRDGVALNLEMLLSGQKKSDVSYADLGREGPFKTAYPSFSAPIFLRNFRSQNYIMSHPSKLKENQPVDEEMRDQAIIEIDSYDEVIRTLSYFHTRDKALLAEERYQDGLMTHLFRSDHLIHQLLDEPRVATKLLGFIEDNLEFFGSKNDWKTCLFFTYLGNRIAAFTKEAQKINPEKFTRHVGDLVIPDFREKLLKEILPHCKTAELELMAISYLAKMHDKSDQDFVAITQDLITLDLYKTSGYRKTQDTLMLYFHFLPKIIEDMDASEDFRNQILNHVATLLSQTPTNFFWSGTFPTFKAANGFIIDLDKKTFTGSVKKGEELPFEIIADVNAKDLFPEPFTIKKNAEFLEIVDSCRVTRITSFDPSFANDQIHMFREIDSIKYQYIFGNQGPFPCDFNIVSPHAKVWLCQDAENPHYRVESIDGKTYFYKLAKVFNGEKNDWENRVISISDALENGNELVFPESSFIEEKLKALEDKRFIRFWAAPEEKKHIKTIDIPRLNLHFEIRSTKREGDRAFCKEIPGFYISNNQNVDFKLKLNECLILENSLGEKKVIIPRRNIITLGEGGSQQVTPSHSLEEKTPYFVYDLEENDGNIQLKANYPEDTFYLVYGFLRNKQYAQAFRYLEISYGLTLHSKNALEIANWILSNNHDQHPSAVLIRLQLALNIQENHTKYSPKEESPHKYKLDQIANDYDRYLENLSNTKLPLLNKDDEILLIKTILNNPEQKPTDPLYLRRLSRLETLTGIKQFPEGLSAPNEKLDTLAFIRVLSNDIDEKILPEKLSVSKITLEEFANLVPAFYHAIKTGSKATKQKVNQWIELLNLAPTAQNANFKNLLNHLKAVSRSPKSFPSLQLARELYQGSKWYENIYRRNQLEKDFVRQSLKHFPRTDNSKFPSFEDAQKAKQVKIAEKTLKNTALISLSDSTKLDNEIGKKVRQHIDSPAMTEEGANALKKMESEIVKLINTVSADTSLSEAVAKQGRQVKLTLRDALDLFESGSLDEYKDKTQLSSVEIPKLEKLVVEYLLKATHHERLIQIQREISLRDALPNDAKEDREVLQKRIDKQIKVSRQFLKSDIEDSIKRAFLVFEYHNKIFLREKQVTAISEMLKQNTPMQLLAQLGTGSGKSKVIAPLFQWLRRRVPNAPLVMNLWPSALYGENRQDIRQHAEGSFGQRADTFDFVRNSLSTVEQLTFIENELKKAIKEKRQLSGIPESAQSFELKFIEFLHRLIHVSGGTETEKIAAFQNILKLFAKTEVHVDESHVNLSPRRMENFTLGDQSTELSQYVLLIEKLYRFIISDNRLSSIVRLKDNKQGLMSPESYNEVVTKLTDLMAKELKIPKNQSADFKAYVLGGEKVPRWISSDPRRSQFALLRGEFNLLLKSTLQQSVDDGFGLSHRIATAEDPSPPEFAKPYDAADSCLETAEFENIHETINKTYQTYLYKRLSVDQEWKLVKKLQNEVLAELNQRVVGTPAKDTKAYKFYEKHFPKGMGNLLLLKNEDVEKFHEGIQQSDEVVFRYIHDFIIPEIKRFPFKIQSNAQNLRSMFNSLMTMSATPGHQNIYGANLTFREDSKNDVAILKKLDEAKNQKINVIEASKPLDILNSILKQSFTADSDFRMLIDVGSLFKGVSNLKVAQTMLDHFKAVDPEKKIKGIVFCDSNDRLVILERGRTQPIPLNESTLEPHERYTYCANKQIFGLDTKQMPKAKGLVTCEVNTDLDSVLQGMGRLREFMQEQTVEWALTSESKETICGKDKIKFNTLKKLFKVNREANEADNLYRSLKQQMSNELREKLMKKLIYAKPNEVIALFKAYEQTLVEAVESDPFKLYGQESENISGAKSLRNHKEKVIKQLNQVDKLSRKEKREILKKLNQYDKVIDKLEKEKKLPAQVKEMQDQLESNCEVQQNTEMQTETQQVTAPEVVEFPDEREISPWPNTLNIVKDKWVKPVRPNADALIAKINMAALKAINKVTNTLLIKPVEGLMGKIKSKWEENKKVQAIAIGTLTAVIMLVTLVATIALKTARLAISPAFWAAHKVVNLGRKEEKYCQLYRVSDVLRIEDDRAISDAYRFFKDDDEKTGQLLMTDNFVRKQKKSILDISVKALGFEQKPLYQMLVIQDILSNGQKKMTVIMGDQYTDMDTWSKQLKNDQKLKIDHDRKICIYDLNMEIVQDSHNPFDLDELKQDKTFQKLLVKAKLYNGDVRYSPQEIDSLKEMVKDPVTKKQVSRFFNKAIAWHTEKVKAFPSSPIDLALRETVVGK